MGRPRTHLTPASASSSTSLVERTYTDTLIISAASSEVWSIPDNCISLKATSHDLNFSATSSLLYIQLVKNSDGSGSAFSLKRSSTNNNTVETQTAQTFPVNMRANDSSDARAGVWVEVLHPRSSTKKTLMKADCFAEGNGDSPNNADFYTVTAVQDTAEDVDELKFEASSGNITGDIYITYTVTEALG